MLKVSTWATSRSQPVVQCECGPMSMWTSARVVSHSEQQPKMQPSVPTLHIQKPVPLCQHKLLLTVASDVAAYWDTAKNGLTPDQVTARRHARRRWLCQSLQDQHNDHTPKQSCTLLGLI